MMVIRMKQKVLFVCTGNSCRSQMAEGFLRHIAGDKYEAYSAGTHPSTLNPRATEVMREVGIDISGQRSKSLDEFLDRDMDIVITVCDHAKETCPVFPNANKTLHWSFSDPAEAGGSEEEILQVFRKIRDQIHNKIKLELDKVC